MLKVKPLEAVMDGEILQGKVQCMDCPNRPVAVIAISICELNKIPATETREYMESLWTICRRKAEDVGCHHIATMDMPWQGDYEVAER